MPTEQPARGRAGYADGLTQHPTCMSQNCTVSDDCSDGCCAYPSQLY